MDTILFDNKKCLILSEGDLALLTPINTALVTLQIRHLNDSSFAYYGAIFLQFLQEQNISDISCITANSIRLFSDHLISIGKTPSVLQKYATLLDNIFDSFMELNGRPHPTLLHGDAVYAAGGRGSAKRKHYTLAGTILRRKIPKKVYTRSRPMASYTKWLAPDEIECICQALSLRNRCVFLCCVETGYRISSTLSVMDNFEHIRDGIVEETFSKTGLTHQAQISPRLQTDIVEYVTTERLAIIEKTKSTCTHLFLSHKGETAGQPFSYGAYYDALKTAEQRIHDKYPSMRHLIIHSHAGRSTYFNTLMHQNTERKQAGKPYLTDAQICQLMDWRSMEPLQSYYDFVERAIPPSLLYQDLMTQ